ncbi:MAG: DNA polymerase III subunit delta [Pseudomonadota bacterium]
MVALKGAAIDRFIGDPPEDATLSIVYGPDSGLVSERGQLIAAQIARRTGGDVVRRDFADKNKSSLFEASQGASLFGGTPVLLLRGAGNGDARTIQSLRQESPETPLVVLAGDLRPGTSLRKLGEGAGAYAVPCYHDDARTVMALAREIAAEQGLSLSADAVRALGDLLGGDRMSTRHEIEKLCLYAAGQTEISTEDVYAVCGDGASYVLGDIADAVGMSTPADADTDLTRARRESLPPQVILKGLRDHFLQLRQARTAVDSGSTAEAAMQALRPRVFFKREQRFRTQLIRWPVVAIDRAVDMIDQADLRARRDADLADAILSRLTFSLARLSDRKRA